MSYYKVILINEVQYQYKDKYTDPCNRIVKKQGHAESILFFLIELQSIKGGIWNK